MAAVAALLNFGIVYGQDGLVWHLSAGDAEARIRAGRRRCKCAARRGAVWWRHTQRGGRPREARKPRAAAGQTEHAKHSALRGPHVGRTAGVCTVALRASPRQHSTCLHTISGPLSTAPLKAGANRASAVRAQCARKHVACYLIMVTYF